MNTLTMWPHYKIDKINGMEQIREYFIYSTDYTLNWLFLSTSGVHGSYLTLEEIESGNLDEEDAGEREEGIIGHVTALIVQPRLVVMYYGEVAITKEDAEFLKTVVKKTLEGVRESQQGNL